MNYLSHMVDCGQLDSILYFKFLRRYIKRPAWAEHIFPCIIKLNV